MVDMFFEFTELCTTIPPLDYGGNEVLLDYFASKVEGGVVPRTEEDFYRPLLCTDCAQLYLTVFG